MLFSLPHAPPTNPSAPTDEAAPSLTITLLNRG